MSNAPGSISNNTDEIDLIAFIERVFRFFIINKVIIIVAVLAGLLLGWLINTRSGKQFSATMMVKSTLLTNAEEIAIISNWNDLIKRHEQEILADELRLPLEVTGKIHELTAEDIMKLYVEKNPIGFRIEAVVSDTTILDTLQTAIVFALENSEYVRVRTAARKADLENLITIGKKEIAALDSTKTGLEKMALSGRGIGGSVLADISDFHTQMIDLSAKVLEYESELKFISPIKVIQGFIKYKKQDGAPLLRKLIIGMVAGFLVAYFIIMIRSVGKKIRQKKSPLT